jgi:hypothetical protein
LGSAIRTRRLPPQACDEPRRIRSCSRPPWSFHHVRVC